MNRRRLIFGLIASAVLAIAGASARAAAAYDDELHDYGLPPATGLKGGGYTGPTPLRVAGAETVATDALKKMIDGPHPPVVFDVRSLPPACIGRPGETCGADALSLPLAQWLPGAGLGGNLHDELQNKLANWLALQTSGNKAAPLVFFGAAKTDWLPVNAALRAHALGYRRLYWYRGGRAAWLAAQYPAPPARLIGSLEPVELAAKSYCDETTDYGVAPASAIRSNDLEAPTPTHVYGAKTVTTPKLLAMLQSGQPTILLDVIGGSQTMTLPGAYWLPGSGEAGGIRDDIEARLAAELDRLTCDDKSVPIVIFCQSKTCWLSVNASLRAVALKYRNIHWYRGGRCAWQEARLPMGPISIVERVPARCQKSRSQHAAIAR